MRSVPSLARSFRMGRLLRPVSGLRFPPLFSVRFVEKGVQQRRFSSQSPSGNSTPNLTNSSKGTGSGSDSSTSGSGQESLKDQLLVALAYFGGCFCVVLLLTDHVFEFTRIDGPSMLPTLNRKGDRVFVWKLGYKPQVGDAVLCRSPEERGSYVLKRIIGKEGDRIYVPTASGEPDVITLRKGFVWLQGDNLLNSNDSRLYGPVPESLIEGKAVFRVWPLPFVKIQRTLEYSGQEQLARLKAMYEERRALESGRDESTSQLPAAPLEEREDGFFVLRLPPAELERMLRQEQQPGSEEEWKQRDAELARLLRDSIVFSADGDGQQQKESRESRADDAMEELVVGHRSSGTTGEVEGRMEGYDAAREIVNESVNWHKRDDGAQKGR